MCMCCVPGGPNWRANPRENVIEPFRINADLKLSSVTDVFALPSVSF